MKILRIYPVAGVAQDISGFWVTAMETKKRGYLIIRSTGSAIVKLIVQGTWDIDVE